MVEARRKRGNQKELEEAVGTEMELEGARGSKEEQRGARGPQSRTLLFNYFCSVHANIRLATAHELHACNKCRRTDHA